MERSVGYGRLFRVLSGDVAWQHIQSCSNLAYRTVYTLYRGIYRGSK